MLGERLLQTASTQLRLDSDTAAQPVKYRFNETRVNILKILLKSAKWLIRYQHNDFDVNENVG